MSCSDCNTKCKHCYISYRGNFSDDDLYYTVCNLSKNGYNIFINGTEPLIHPGFLKSLNFIGQTHVLTNGLVFKNNLRYLDEVKSFGIDTLNISYHFDLHKQISTVPEDYLLELWKEIRLRNMNFTINCTISTLNYDKILDYCQKANKYGAKRIRFTNLLSIGMAKSLDSDLLLNSAQINKVLEDIAKARIIYSTDELYIERCGSFGPNERTKRFKCTAGIERVIMSPNKKIYPCIFTIQEGAEIGYYESGKIFLRNDYKNDGTKCFAVNSLNNITISQKEKVVL